MKTYPNILLIRGTGRNVGKTLTACRIIGRLARDYKPAGVKISSHFHSLDPDERVIYHSDDLIVTEEHRINGKDSSRMLQAGAQKVFYVQAKEHALAGALDEILKFLGDREPLVVESGGLHNYIEPGLTIFIEGPGDPKKVSIPGISRILRLTSDLALQENWEGLTFNNGQYSIND